jgi:hypothetical protein
LGRRPRIIVIAGCGIEGCFLVVPFCSCTCRDFGRLGKGLIRNIVERGPTSVSFTNEIGQIVPSTRQKTYVSFRPGFLKILVIIIILIHQSRKGAFPPHRADPEQKTSWSTKASRQGGNIARADFDPALCFPSHGHAVAHKMRRSHTHNTRAHIPISSKTQRTPSIFEVIAVA